LDTRTGSESDFVLPFMAKQGMVKAKLAKVLSFGLAKDFVMRIRWDNSVNFKSNNLQNAGNVE
jgi:hypothetical protein